MRKISTYKDTKLQKEQFEVLVDVLFNVKNKEDMKLCLGSFLTKSEKAVLSQRLNIMRMLSKHFSYQEIRDLINASPSTIATAQRCLEKGGIELMDIFLSYKFKPKALKNKVNEGNGLISARNPGSIRL